MFEILLQCFGSFTCNRFDKKQHLFLFPSKDHRAKHLEAKTRGCLLYCSVNVFNKQKFEGQGRGIQNSESFHKQHCCKLLLEIATLTDASKGLPRLKALGRVIFFVLIFVDLILKHFIMVSRCRTLLNSRDVLVFLKFIHLFVHLRVEKGYMFVFVISVYEAQ